jgi:hypothetical protein
MTKTFSAEDFTVLESKYSQTCTDYCVSVLRVVLGFLDKPTAAVDIVNVGARTGIRTRMAYYLKPRRIFSTRNSRPLGLSARISAVVCLAQLFGFQTRTQGMTGCLHIPSPV